MAGQSVATLLCLTMCISFVGLKSVQGLYLILSAIGKVGAAGEFMRWASRGQRPRLECCSNANSLITLFARMKATQKNGITSGKIPFVPV
jgi:hypothetical protein